MKAAKTNVAMTRKAFAQTANEAGFSLGDGCVYKQIDQNYSYVCVYDPASRNGRVLAGCDAGLLSHRHQRVALAVTSQLVGVKARSDWNRFWFPFFTAGWAVTLPRTAASSQDIRGFSLHGLQACWYHSEDPEQAAGEIELLARFLATEGFGELSRYASDDSLHLMLGHKTLSRGPNDVLEAILMYARGEREGGGRILRGEIPKKNLFVPEIYPGILQRLEEISATGEMARLLAPGTSTSAATVDRN
jgi:hypothetical protein